MSFWRDSSCGSDEDHRPQHAMRSDGRLSARYEETKQYLPAVPYGGRLDRGCTVPVPIMGSRAEQSNERETC